MIFSLKISSFSIRFSSDFGSISSYEVSVVSQPIFENTVLLLPLIAFPSFSGIIVSECPLMSLLLCSTLNWLLSSWLLLSVEACGNSGLYCSSIRRSIELRLFGVLGLSRGSSWESKSSLKWVNFGLVGSSGFLADLWKNSGFFKKILSVFSGFLSRGSSFVWLLACSFRYYSGLSLVFPRSGSLSALAP